MRRRTVVCWCLILGSLVLAHVAQAENWPGWRGPRGDGTSLETNVPIHWNGETGQHLLWKTPVPGSGHSSPIVWGDRIFLVGCVDQTTERILASLDRKTGKILWKQTVIRSPLEPKHAI